MSVPGILLIVGFIAIVVVCVMLDKKGNEKFDKMIAETYPVKEAFNKDVFVTERGELLVFQGSGTLKGYKKWMLSDVAYVNTDGRGNFSLGDSANKAMKGEYLTPSKKKFLKEKAYSSFYIGEKEFDGLAEFIKKHAPYVKKTFQGKVMD